MAWGWDSFAWISHFPSCWSIRTSKAWQSFGPHNLQWDGGLRPIAPPWHTHDSQLSATLTGALLSKPHRDPCYSRGMPLLLPPSLLPPSPLEQPNEIPAASSCLELPSPFLAERKIQHMLAGTRMLHGASPAFQALGHPSRCPRGSQHLGPHAPHQPWLSFKAIPALRGVGKSHGTSWKPPLFQAGEGG